MKIYSIFKYLPTFLPQKVGSALNRVISSAIVWLLKSEEDKLWVRNSIALGYDEFLKSDIDLTLLTTNKKSNTLNKYNILKRFCPLLQEINVYRNEFSRKYFNKFNICEVSRDPNFKSEYSLAREPSSSEKIVFLVRMIHSNDEFKIRERKLLFYKEHLNTRANIASVYDIFDELLTPQNKNCLNYFVDSNKNKALIEDRTQVILFPNQWIVKAMGTEDEIDDLLDQHKFNEEEIKLIEAALWWEFQGLITQSHSIQDTRKLEDYLIAILELCDYFKLELLEEAFSKFLKDLDDNSSYRP